MSASNFFLVNWVDGMKINKDHFISSENAILESLHKSAGLSLSGFVYGLLPPGPGEKSSLSVSIDLDGHDAFHARIARCKAVTRGGVLVDIRAGGGAGPEFLISGNATTIKLKEVDEGTYYLVLTVDPHTRVPAGEADPDENPPRNPFVVPHLSVDVVRPEQVTAGELGDHFLILGVIRVKDGSASIVEGYIPPSTSVKSHPALLEFHDQLLSFFNNLERDILDIIRKIHIKSQKTNLSASIHFLTTHLLDFLGQNILLLRWTLKEKPPIYEAELLSRFARYMRNTLESLSAEDREELINYFTDWSNLKQGQFEELLLTTINLAYDHDDIAGCLNQQKEFITVITKLFGTLSGLDYIGKRKDTQIFVKEEQKPKRSFLADD